MFLYITHIISSNYLAHATGITSEYWPQHGLIAFVCSWFDILIYYEHPLGQKRSIEMLFSQGFIKRYHWFSINYITLPNFALVGVMLLCFLLFMLYCYVRRWALEPSSARPATLISAYIAWIRGWETLNYNSEARFHSLLCHTYANLLLGGRPIPERMYRTSNKNKSKWYPSKRYGTN